MKNKCVDCKYLDNEIVEGYMKCYWMCPYRSLFTLDNFIKKEE